MLNNININLKKQSSSAKEGVCLAKGIMFFFNVKAFFEAILAFLDPRCFVWTLPISKE